MSEKEKVAMIRPEGLSPFVLIHPQGIWDWVEAGEEGEIWEIKYLLMSQEEIKAIENGPEFDGW